VPEMPRANANTDAPFAPRPAGACRPRLRRSGGVPRFWATIWIDRYNFRLLAPTREHHLRALDRLYLAAQRQRGSDCLDRLMAEPDFDAIETILDGFFGELRNESPLTASTIHRPGE